MRLKFYILLFLFVALQVTPVGAQSKSDSELNREYQIKAAFLYNFIKFVDWPEGKIGDQNEPIMIGIIGKDPFGDAFKPITSKQIKGKKSRIIRFEGLEQLKTSSEANKSKIESLRKCHLLFICISEKDHLTEILNLVNKHSVLTAGETSSMLKSGGMINFLMEENKIRFEVNLIAVKQANLKMRSQLLRLATRVIDDNNRTRK